MRARSESGITLVEALIALTVLALGITAAFETAARTLNTQAGAERHLEAVALAEAKMNELAILPIDSLKRYTEGSSGETALAARRYRWRAIVRPENDRPTLWSAAVRIEWEGGDFDLETILFRRGRSRALERGQ